MCATHGTLRCDTDVVVRITCMHTVTLAYGTTWVSKYQRTEWEHTHEWRIGVLTWRGIRCYDFESFAKEISRDTQQRCFVHYLCHATELTIKEGYFMPFRMETFNNFNTIQWFDFLLFFEFFLFMISVITFLDFRWSLGKWMKLVQKYMKKNLFFSSKNLPFIIQFKTDFPELSGEF